ncbi:MAG: hypothetical protein SZ59_C0002G0155 [candidate division TM6 bacterium GW2011_GWF2_28_16]|nr:MAG: hypothetical protein SZ59_C0002G0155 [candidate division TM6 bacterium GW2011_GWF2_28_16]
MKKLTLIILLGLFLSTACSAIDIIIKNNTKKNWNIAIESKGSYIFNGSVRMSKYITVKNMPYNEMLAIQATARSVGKAIGGDSASGRPMVSSTPETIRKNIIYDKDFTVVINECTTSDPDCRSITDEKELWEKRDCADDISYYLELEDL